MPRRGYRRNGSRSGSWRRLRERLRPPAPLLLPRLRPPTRGRRLACGRTATDLRRGWSTDMTDYDVAATWAGLTSSIVSDCLGRFRVMEPAIADLVGVPLVGPAFTVQVVPGENGTIHRAVAAAPMDAVLGIEGGGGKEGGGGGGGVT